MSMYAALPARVTAPPWSPWTSWHVSRPGWRYSWPRSRSSPWQRRPIPSGSDRTYLKISNELMNLQKVKTTSVSCCVVFVLLRIWRGEWHNLNGEMQSFKHDISVRFWRRNRHILAAFTHLAPAGSQWGHHVWCTPGRPARAWHG